jgi:hypothetical protein
MNCILQALTHGLLSSGVSQVTAQGRSRPYNVRFRLSDSAGRDVLGG